MTINSVGLHCRQTPVLCMRSEYIIHHPHFIHLVAGLVSKQIRFRHCALTYNCLGGTATSCPAGGARFRRPHCYLPNHRTKTKSIGISWLKHKMIYELKRNTTLINKLGKKLLLQLKRQSYVADFAPGGQLATSTSDLYPCCKISLKSRLLCMSCSIAA